MQGVKQRGLSTAEQRHVQSHMSLDEFNAQVKAMANTVAIEVTKEEMRDLIIPAPLAREEPAPTGERPQEPPVSGPARPRRIPWAELLRRVFRSEVDRCSCGGRLKLVAFVTEPAQAARYLSHVGLPAQVPIIAPARAPPQPELAFELS